MLLSSSGYCFEYNYSLIFPPILNSDGHFQQTDIDPEMKRNMPSIVEEKQAKKDKK